MNQILESQQTPHNSPSRARYGVPIVRIWEKFYRVITARHCTFIIIVIVIDIVMVGEWLCETHWNHVEAEFKKNNINVIYQPDKIMFILVETETKLTE